MIIVFACRSSKSGFSVYKYIQTGRSIQTESKRSKQRSCVNSNSATTSARFGKTRAKNKSTFVVLPSVHPISSDSNNRGPSHGHAALFLRSSSAGQRVLTAVTCRKSFRVPCSSLEVLNP